MNPWLPYNSRKPSGGMRMFCFPPGGAGAIVFRPWMAMLKPVIEVCPIEFPGRLARIREPAAESIVQLANAIAEVLEGEIAGPFVMFGYSMGSTVAFETIRELRRRLGIEPEVFFVAARHAPNVVKPSRSISHITDAELLAWFQDTYGAFPKQLLNDPDLLRMVTSILRCDARIAEEYTYTAELRLGCPIHVFAGKDDRSTRDDELRAWQFETTAHCSLEVFAGGHFFWENCMADLAQAVRSHVARDVERVLPSR